MNAGLKNRRVNSRIFCIFTRTRLYIHKKYAMIKNAERRRGIPVRAAAPKGGPKNPLKGISVKPLASACYAQFRAGAGGKRIRVGQTA